MVWQQVWMIVRDVPFAFVSKLNFGLQTRARKASLRITRRESLSRFT